MASSEPPNAGGQSSTSDAHGSTVEVKIMSPSADVPAGLCFQVHESSTIDQLKERISHALVTKPPPTEQKLIYRGKVLVGSAQIGPILIGNQEKQDTYTVHLVVNPPQSPVSNPTITNPFLQRTVPHAPNPPNPGLPGGLNPFAGLSQSAPVTTSTTTSTIRNGTSGITTTTTRIATSFSGNASLRNPFLAFGQQAEQGGSSAAMGPIPVGGIIDEEQIRQRVRQHIRDAQMRAGGQTSAGASSGISLPGTQQPSITVGQSQLFGSRPAAAPSGEASNASSASNGNLTTSTPATNSSTDTNASSPPPPRNPFGPDGSLPAFLRDLRLPAELDQELLRAVASGQPTTEAAAADARRRALQESLRDIEDELRRENPIPPQPQAHLFVPPPPLFSSPLVQPTVLQPTILQPLPGAAVAIPPGRQLFLLQDPSGRPHSLLVGPSSAATFVPQPPDLDLNLQIQQLQRDLRRLNFRTRNVGAVRRPWGTILRRLRLRAGNYLWLALKLVVFVVLFTGNGGWRRMLYLGSIAVVIFVWQTGLARPLINAFNPPAPRNPAPVAPGQPDPAHLAQALLERQEEGPRRVWRAVERCVGLFLASLVPGLHERHVEAVERRQQVVQEEQRRDEEEEPAEMGGAEVIGGVL